MKTIHDPRYREFIICLIDARTTSGITQTQLAKRLGRSQSYVAKIEGMDRRLDLVELADWLRALNCGAMDFLARLSWWD